MNVHYMVGIAKVQNRVDYHLWFWMPIRSSHCTIYRERYVKLYGKKL